ncbi:MAG: PD-(D/E)XK nuclease family protein, partial [Actinomycetota bacterium]
AVTRAARRISISGHAWDGSIKNAREPSELYLIAESLEGALKGPREIVADSNPAPAPFVESAPAPDPLFPEGVGSAVIGHMEDPDQMQRDHSDLWPVVTERVQQLELAIADLAAPAADTTPPRFSVSVTNLVALARCARKFNWIHHERLPQKPRRSAVEGTAFHRRVELHHLGVISLDDASPAAYDDPPPSAESETPAKHTPWELFEESRFAESPPVHVETPFEIASAGGTIRGKVDAIYETEPGHWEIVDYKSGRHRDDPARAVQLEAYAVAAAEGAIASPPPDQMEVTFAYFGGGSLVEASESVDDDWLEQARTHVSELMTLGEHGPFEPAPESDCKWCDFLHLCPEGRAFVRGQRTN